MNTENIDTTTVDLDGFGFRGIAVKDDAAKVKFVRDVRGEEAVQTDDLTFDIPDRPHDDLLDALDNLTEQYLDILELPDEVAEHVTITGLEIKGQNPPELKVAAKRYLPGVDTTIRQAAPAAPPVSGDLQDVIYNLMQEAILCIEGKRHQLSLPLEEEAPQGTPAEDLPTGTGGQLPEPEAEPAMEAENPYPDDDTPF